MTVNDSSSEIIRGDRFAFGENWSKFLKVLDEDRIQEAEKSLKQMLGLSQLDGLTFLDIGSGSGLFSLAAWRLGAKVHSFDFDAQSVASTKEVRRRYCTNEETWLVDTASVLDKDFLNRMGEFDIVYSWGVLHHTGDMWQAMKNITMSIAPSGLLFIALYNDQGNTSKFWRAVKRLYCSSKLGKFVVKVSFFPIFILTGLIHDTISGVAPHKRYANYRKKRGMSVIHDWIDWFGGYPYEVAKVDDVFEFYSMKNFSLVKIRTCQTLGCNEYVFINNKEQ